ncbi:outer membrane protein OmpK [Providencia stuartii]
MKKQLLCAAALVSLAGTANADDGFLGYQNGFADINVNYLDWSHRTETKSEYTSRKKDFAYIELEGGANFNWGELYGFFDVENPFHKRRTESGRNQRYTIKTTGRFYLGDSGFNVYGHVYGTWSLPGAKYGGNFHEVNTLYGLGYNTAFGDLWFKPFIAMHYVDQSFYSGNNGYVVGWVAGYGFKMFEENFMITNWHEMEFARHKRYGSGNGGRDGVNGALAFWWNATPNLAAGVQYRYADNKLGEDFYQDAIIYTLKYTF